MFLFHLIAFHLIAFHLIILLFPLICIHPVTSAPNGINASLASLNCWRPNGIPITVTHRTIPKTACSTARGRPETNSHRIFSSSDPAPPPYLTSLPNGKKLSTASLKHWIPTGIPMIVMHQRPPARSQLRPARKPPKINHKRLPRQFKFEVLHTYSFISCIHSKTITLSFFILLFDFPFLEVNEDSVSKRTVPTDTYAYY